MSGHSHQTGDHEPSERSSGTHLANVAIEQVGNEADGATSLKRPASPLTNLSTKRGKSRKRNGYGSPVSSSEEESPQPIEEEGQSRASTTSSPGNVLKVMSWNCDGLSKYLSIAPTGLDSFVKKSATKKPSAGSVLRALLLKQQPDILCLQEVHLWTTEVPQLKRQLAIDAPGYAFHACLPLGKSGRRRAGVLTLYRTSTITNASVSTVDWDHEGRLSLLKFDNVAIFNVYCLNSSENDYKDPHSGTVRGTRSERKREFDKLLESEMARECRSGRQVVTLGDLNVSRYPIDALGGHLRTGHPHVLNRSHFNTLFGAYRDVIRELFPETPKFSWFSRVQEGGGVGDKARVDLVLAGAGVEVVDGDTLEDPSDRAQSDHGPLFVRIKRTPRTP